MAIYVRPINANDVDTIASGIVKNEAAANMKRGLSNTIMDNELFGRTHFDEYEKGKNYEYEYTRTARIKLALPIVNPFLAGAKGRIMKVLLNMSEKECERIMYGKVAYCPETGEHVSVDEAKSKEQEVAFRNISFNREKWLIGGDYFRFLLNNLYDNIDEVIEKHLYAHYVWQLFDKDTKKYINKNYGAGIFGTIKEVPDSEIMWMDDSGAMCFHPGWIVDNYVWIAPEGECQLNLDRDKGLTVLRQELYQQSARYPYLMAFKKNPDNVFNLIMDDIFVLPKGYRPNSNGFVEALNTQYNALVRCNIELNESTQYLRATLESTMMKYTAIMEHVRYIFLGIEGPSVYKSKDFRCLKDRLSVKNGLIRDKMMGVRSDYTGRTVITCDPNMPLDCIGVPRKVLNKLLELDLVKEEKVRTGGKRNVRYMTSPNNIRNMRQKAEELVRDEYLIIGRQPTLFYLGIQAFKVIPVDGNSLVLSPLVVMPFNADFDGDTMHYNWPVSNEAKNEVRNLIASSKNLFYPKNGELTVAPRHEISYGLWACVAMSDINAPWVANRNVDGFEYLDSTKYGKRVANVWTAASLTALAEKMNKNVLHGQSKLDTSSYVQIVYEGVCRQEINVYDIVNAPTSYGASKNGSETVNNLEGKPAGIWAIKHVVGKSLSDYVVGGKKLHKYGDVSKVKGKDGQLKVYDDISATKEFEGATMTKWFKAILNEVKEGEDSTFISVVNKMTRLGFAVAEIWPPSVTGVTDINLGTLIEDFNKKVAEREEFINMGIEIPEAFTQYFNEEYDVLSKKLGGIVVDSLGNDNGFVRMWRSGAKGNESNLVQLFGMKGRIMRDDVTAFNTIIGTSLSEQLNGLEHFISAYGSRQGIVDKVLSTAKPGYLTRQLEHTSPSIYITEEDCGTSDGIVWTYDDIIQFVDPINLTSDDRINIDFVREYVCRLIQGRWIVDNNGTSIYISNEAEAITAFARFVAEVDKANHFHKYSGIVVRSPITCKNPCCAKCYGKDLTRNETFAKVGKPVGFVAAQAVSEPGTQLTMKNFQSGGVAKDANLTSAFQTIEKVLHLESYGNNPDGSLAYDALSPKEGFVKGIRLGNGLMKIAVNPYPEMKKLSRVLNGMYDTHITLEDGIVIYIGETLEERMFFTEKLLSNLIKGVPLVRVHFAGFPIEENMVFSKPIGIFYDELVNSKAFPASSVNGSTFLVDEDLKLKRFVRVGDSFQAVQGRLDIKNVMDIRGPEAAYKYLLLTLFDIFNKETEVSMQHFETVVSDMIFKVVLKGNDYVSAGECLNLKEYRSMKDVDKLITTDILIGTKTIPKYRRDFLESMFMENMTTFVPRALLLNPKDSMTNPKNRVAFGLRINMGSDIEGYISDADKDLKYSLSSQIEDARKLFEE